MNNFWEASQTNKKTHGFGGTPTYRTWYSMLERCRNPKNASWRYYGARGISVCERWHDLLRFVEDMGIRPHGMSIDRIDNYGNYEPSNCRWALEIDQQRHRRNIRCNKLFADDIRAGKYEGMTNREIAALVGCDPSTISRIKSGEAWL